MLDQTLPTLIHVNNTFCLKELTKKLKMSHLQMVVDGLDMVTMNRTWQGCELPKSVM